MNTVLLNLPNKNQVIRRYMCSYNAPNFLFPPLELMYLGGVVQDWKKDSVELIDAIAEKKDVSQIVSQIKEIKPDILVFMTGFEIFSEDMDVIEKLKTELPETKFICFGYLPTVFPQEVLEKTNIDFIIMGEPEISFSELYDKLRNNDPIGDIKGVAYREQPLRQLFGGSTPEPTGGHTGTAPTLREDGKIVINSPRERINDLDALPFPSRSLIKSELYSEPMMDKPFTIIQTARGCPFGCTYCVRTYGRKLIKRSPENIVAEVEEAINKSEVKSIRFIDDTFTVDKDRVVDICNLLLKRGIKIKWTCLSRIDTLENEMLRAMKKAGCQRIYIGIESGSQKVLDFYQKRYKVEAIKEKVHLVNKVGIETTGFFMVGAPIETEDDLEVSINLAKEADFDYIAVFKTIAYPNTPLFEMQKDMINFSLFPYQNQLKDRELEEKYEEWERTFYRKYYFRWKYILKKLGKFMVNSKVTLAAIKSFYSYLFRKKKEAREDFI